jgi:transcriptional regulator with XRE-family HTH domain
MTKKVNISTNMGANFSTVSEAISRRIKEYRKQRKLSFDQLSLRAGISKGMLVEIENARANPSITMLCKISAALGISVADIVLVDDPDPIHLVEQGDIPVLWSGPKGGTARLLIGTSGSDMFELWRWEMFPGEIYESPGHSAGTFELFHVEKGTLKLKVDATELVVSEGCSAVAKTDVPHHYANSSDSITIFTLAVAEPNL